MLSKLLWRFSKIVRLCNIFQALSFLDLFSFLATFQDMAELIPKLVEMTVNDKDPDVRATGMKLLLPLAKDDSVLDLLCYFDTHFLYCPKRYQYSRAWSLISKMLIG